MITLTSTTQSPEEMAAALSDPRYGNQQVEPPAPATETPAAPLENKPSETPAEPPVESKTVTEQAPVKTTQEQDDPDGPDPEPQTEEEIKAESSRHIQRKLSRNAARLGKERGKREAAEAQAAQLRQELADLRSQAPKPTPQPEPEPAAPQAEVKPAAVVEKPEPKVEDFPDSYEDYIKALTDYKVEKAVAIVIAKADEKITALETKLAESTTAKEKAAVADEIWNAKVEKAKAKLPDFDTVMKSETANKLQVSPVMASAIADSDIGPEIGHYLVNHPDVAERIFAATSLTKTSSQAEISKAIMTIGREFGRIEDELSKPVTPVTPPAAAPVPDPPAPEKPQPVQPPVSSAPRPMTPVGTRSATSVTTEPPTNSSEYLKWREEQIRKRAG